MSTSTAGLIVGCVFLILILIIITSAIVACCCSCKGWLCHKPGYPGRTIAPAPFHMTTELVPPNNRLPPLCTHRHIDNMFTGNTFNNYYDRRCTCVLHDSPHIGNSVGYYSPQLPPDYHEESRQPPPYDGRQTPPLSLANDAVNGGQSHPSISSTQRLQPRSPRNQEPSSVGNISETLADNQTSSSYPPVIEFQDHSHDNSLEDRNQNALGNTQQ